MSRMYIKEEETYEDEVEDPLVNVDNSENFTKDEEIPSEFGIKVENENCPKDGESPCELEIKFENDKDDGYAIGENIEERVKWEEIKIEPHEVTSVDVIPGSSEHSEPPKEPYEITSVDVIPRSSERTEPPKYSVTLQMDEVELQPFKKMKHNEEESTQSLVFSQPKYFQPGDQYGVKHIINQLGAVHLMSENDASTLALKFVGKLLEWVSIDGHVKLHMYQLRLKAANLALSMGIAGFTPDDGWFLNFKHKFFSRFAKYKQWDKKYDDGDDELLKILAIWYHSTASKLMVSPGQLERTTCNMATKIGLKERYPSKDEVRSFVEQQGLYCNVNGKVAAQLMKVKTGLLKYFFEAKFEAWYHHWPVSTDDLLQDIKHLGKKHWTMFKSYLAILSEWLVQTAGLVYQHCPGLSVSDINKSEIKFAVAVFGSDLAVYYKFYAAFKSKLKTEINKIKSFSDGFGNRFCHRPYSFCSEHLKKNAEEVALSMGFPEISINSYWLRRFAELSVGCSLSLNTSHDHPRDSHNYFPMNRDGFDIAFRNWYNKGSPRKMVANGCIAGSSKKPQGLQDKVDTNHLNGYMEFLVEIGKWYKQQVAEGFVKPYELMAMSEEIAQLMGLKSFKATKVWMNHFVMLKGLKYYNEHAKTIVVSKGKTSPDQQFVELFEIWYSEGTCSKCAKRMHSELDDKQTSPQSLFAHLDHEQNELILQYEKNAIENAAIKKPGLVEPTNIDTRPTSSGFEEKTSDDKQTPPQSLFTQLDHKNKELNLLHEKKAIENTAIKTPALVEPTIDTRPTSLILEEKTSDAGPSKPEAGVHVEFEFIMRTWYELQSELSCTVEPGDLEKRAMAVADELNMKNFIPSETWIEAFINQHGLYCGFDGNRKPFFKSEFEFLRHKFLGDFEVWYHMWPFSFEDAMLKDDDAGSNVCFREYGQALLNWYLEVSKLSRISLHDIKTKSNAIIYKKMPGITRQDVDVWTKQWCRQYDHVMQKFRVFDYTMRMWYFERRNTSYIIPEELRVKAEKCAGKMEIPNFRATRIWLKRFVERNGIYSITAGVLKFLSFNDILRLKLGEFDKLVSAWYDCSRPSGNTRPQLIGSLVGGSECDTEFSLVDGGAENVKMVVGTGDHLVSVFEDEVSAWFKSIPEKEIVSPGEYLATVLEIRESSGLTVYNGLTLGFDQRKRCMKRLVERHGIHLDRLPRHWFVKAECGILKWWFELAFEVWYHAFPLQVECVKVDGYSLHDDDQNLINKYLSALHEWYVFETTGDVSAEEIRIQETELANSLTISKVKREVIARWCSELCSKYVAWIKQILSLDSNVSEWYRPRKYCTGRSQLGEKVKEMARDLNIEEFSVTNDWLKRFVQLH